MHASQVVEMHEPPMVAIRKKKDSSIRVGIGLVKAGKADAFVSAGHSGVVMATSLMMLGTAKVVDRPAIATLMPTLKDTFIMLDVGATVDCNPHNLLQFALMGSTYCRLILGRPDPKVALLSIGEEDIKGNEVTKEAFKLIKKSKLNFIGNIEGKDIFSGMADVVVCDGFIGNIALKISEGLAETILKMLKREISSRLHRKDRISADETSDQKLQKENGLRRVRRRAAAGHQRDKHHQPWQVFIKGHQKCAEGGGRLCGKEGL